MSATHASAAKIWGRVLLHNKIITQAQWDTGVETFKQRGGAVPMEKILLEQGTITPRIVELVGRKVHDLIDKAGGAASTPAASSPPAPATQPEPSKPSPNDARPGHDEASGNDDSGIIPLDDDEPDETAPNAAATQASDEDDLMPSFEDAGDGIWKPSDAEWVESSDERVATKGVTHEFDDSAIELDDDDEPAAATTKPKIIVNEGGGLARLGRAAAVAGRPPISAKPNVFADEAATDEPVVEHISSGVTPMALDPEAVALLRKAVEIQASDVHLASGTPPFYRVHGALVFTQRGPLTPEEAQRMTLGFMSDKQQQQWLKHHDLDFSYEHPELGRFRVNALLDFHGPAIIFRVIPSRVPTLKELDLPQDLERFTQYHQGLVLITGPAGAGKTTTAAALIDLVNKSRKDHIITVEDPIEFLHKSKGCNVTQRQVPIHTQSFASALRAALREDPDVIMIGELRDLETMSLAIRAAETGHLVIGTLQTKSAPRTIDRVVDVFPADQQAQIRTMLSESLRGIISQQLIPRKDGKGRVVSLEVLFVNNAVSNLIRDSKTFQLHSLMQTGRKIGHRLMDDSLEAMYLDGLITKEEAAKAAENPKRFQGNITAE